MKEYTESELLHLQQCELMMLHDLDAICKENNIDYFLWGGTAIGVLRHKGFIPWDDDIDIGFQSSDLDKLIDIIQTYYSEKYEVINAGIDINYPLSTTRLMLRGTKFREEALGSIQCHLGIFLDLYAFDNVPQDEKLYRKQAWDAWFWSHLRMLYFIPRPSIFVSGIKGSVIRTICRAVSFFLRMGVISPEFMYRKEMEARSRYSEIETGRFGYMCDTSRFTSTYLKTEVFPVSWQQFEDMDAPVPNNVKKHLEMLYGDYMTLPPVEKRKNHYPQELEFGEY